MIEKDVFPTTVGPAGISQRIETRIVGPVGERIAVLTIAAIRVDGGS